MFEVKCLIADVKSTLRSHCARSRSSIKHPTSNIRTGISLIEILVSIFVLLFGLMGVAAIFPVGNHYVSEGEKHDLGSSLAQNSFEELVARGLLRPEIWLYADPPADRDQNNSLFIQNGGSDHGFFNVPIALPSGSVTSHPGYAFVLDPLSSAPSVANTGDDDYWPVFDWNGNPNTVIPAAWTTYGLPGATWPLRRITLAQADGNIADTPVAETIFRLRDDLAVTQPERDDFPGIQNWAVNDQGTADPTDDVLLRRQYKGDFSWLATIVPTSSEALQALQPSYNSSSYGELRCDVSVVVFHRREFEPSVTSERLIQARLESQGEVAIYAVGTSAAEKKLVDDAVEEIRPGNWIALMGVNQITGDFIMKWYRLLAIDEDSYREDDYIVFKNSTTENRENVYLRRMMIDGPDWPSESSYDLRAVIMPGVIGVATHQLHMEDTSLWSLE